MKARKVTVTIKCQTLSIQSVSCLIHSVIEQLKGETIAGSLSTDDGDCISWNTKFENIDF